jgi:hypothetical protein
LYPNPAANFIKIDLKNTATAKLQMYDVLGQLILSLDAYHSSDLLDTSNLKAGVYFIKIKAKNKETTKQIIKE